VAIVKGNPARPPAARGLGGVQPRMAPAMPSARSGCDCRPSFERLAAMIEAAGEGVVVFSARKGEARRSTSSRPTSLPDGGPRHGGSQRAARLMRQMSQLRRRRKILSDIGGAALAADSQQPAQIAGPGAMAPGSKDRVPLMMIPASYNAPYFWPPAWKSAISCKTPANEAKAQAPLWPAGQRDANR